ncbi:GNAT family N-acetyltransferase [Nonomuraea montanisoli]|uniref:GNAT family N-acetyltransferase n=1 Tax=Nonomuraea montanisoli TaxID=2741721 RepID=UPI001F467240|nr:GNAT family protein [Nonomuraea montanisoli]
MAAVSPRRRCRSWPGGRSGNGLFRLELGHRVDNPASCRVAAKAGFLAEGIERGKLVYDGVRHDVERHARLATD